MYHCISYSVRIVSVRVYWVMHFFLKFFGDVDVVSHYNYSFRSSLHQDVPHGFNELLSIIKTALVGDDSTRVGVIVWPSCTKPDSGINIMAVICIVGYKTDPCYSSLKLPKRVQWVKIEPLSVAVNLRGRLWTNQGPPCVTTQISRTVLSVSDQRVQGICLLIAGNEPELLVDLHTKTDLGEWCVPVSW